MVSATERMVSQCRSVGMPTRSIRQPCGTKAPKRIATSPFDDCREPAGVRLSMRPTATGSCSDETTPPATSTVRANPAISPETWKAATSGVGPRTPAEMTRSPTMAHSW